MIYPATLFPLFHTFWKPDLDRPPTQLRTEFNLLLMNLVVTELVMAAYGIPVDWLAAVGAAIPQFKAPPPPHPLLKQNVALRQVLSWDQVEYSSVIEISIS